MNDFKYQKKANKSDEDLLPYKDFNTVMQKHNAMASSYNLVKKWAIISTAGLAVVTVAILFGMSDKNEEVTEHPIEIEAIQDTPSAIQPSLLAKEGAEVLVAQQEEITSINIVPETKPVFINEKSKSNEQENESVEVVNEKLEERDTLIKTSNAFEPTVWYTVNEIPDNERIKLPTLFVSKLAWPDQLTKTELVKFPNINALYKSVAREIPIVDGTAYITTNNSTYKESGIKLKGNNFPPGLIRAIHKADENAVLLLKDIKLFLPGKGYINIGDKKIDIVIDQNYKKKLEQTQVIE